MYQNHKIPPAYIAFWKEKYICSWFI